MKDTKSSKNDESQPELIGFKDSNGELTPLYAPPRGSIVTQAFINCKSCGKSVYHCMGPRYDTLCLSCAKPTKKMLDELAADIEKRLKAKIG